MWFFSKKEFLIDHIEGIVDIHNHILPAIDDGSPNMKTTVDMLELFVSCGIKKIIATPHTMADYYGNDAQGIVNNFNQTQSNLSANSNQAVIRSVSSEYMLDDGFESIFTNKEYLPLKDNILLTELSYFQKPNNLLELCYEMITSNVQPILAHPERYSYFKDLSEYLKLKEHGFDLQLNLLSLSGHYGNTAQKTAEQLLLNKKYDYLGTDAHKPEHLIKLKSLQISKKIADSLKGIVEKQREF